LHLGLDHGPDLLDELLVADLARHDLEATPVSAGASTGQPVLASEPWCDP